MLGTFVSTYKFVLNSLPILLPEPKSPRAIPRHRPHQPRSRSQFRSEHGGLLRAPENAFAEEEEEEDEHEQQGSGSKQKQRTHDDEDEEEEDEEDEEEDEDEEDEDEGVERGKKRAKVCEL